MYKESQTPYIIGTVYRPPHANIISFTDPLTETINIPNINKTAIYILRGFNIDYGDFRRNGRKFRADMQGSHALQQLITRIKRIARLLLRITFPIAIAAACHCLTRRCKPPCT